MRRDKWTKEKATLLHLEPLNTSLTHFLAYQEAKAVSSHAKRSSLLRRLMAWHKDSWQTAKTGLSGSDRSGDVRSESYTTCLPTHWSPAGERKEAHKSTEKKWKKNKGLKQTAPQNKTFLNKDTNTYQHKRQQGESKTKTVCYRT